MTFTCSICKMLIESPDDPILDALRDVRQLDRAGQVAIQHFRTDHPEKLAETIHLATSITKYFALKALLPINAHAPMFASGMEKLRVNLGGAFEPDSNDSPSPASSAPPESSTVQ